MASRARDRTRNPLLLLAADVKPLHLLLAKARGGVARDSREGGVDSPVQRGGCRITGCGTPASGPGGCRGAAAPSSTPP